MLKQLFGVITRFRTLAPVFAFFQGRHTFFALFFSIAGTYLAYHGELTPTYVGLITAMQAFVLTHSYKEDKSGKNNANGD